jgi:phosphatidylserine decarboxylase
VGRPPWFAAATIIMTTDRLSVTDRLFVLLQYLLPQHAISRLVHRATRVRTTWFKNALIRTFIRTFRVDMADAADSDVNAYEHFNAFFTRSLHPESRPLPESPEDLACPVDGTVSMTGQGLDGELIQAKDRRFRLDDLLGDRDMAEELSGGVFATLYLAPFDYHRIHMPADGRLTRMHYIPGRLFSVNAATVRSVPRLFARNERVVCRFETPHGPMAMVLVGALNVGSIETVWAGEVAPSRPRERRTVAYDAGINLGRGEEMGRFNMGSTVIVVFPAGRVSLKDDLDPGEQVRMGQILGRWVSQSPA